MGRHQRTDHLSESPRMFENGLLNYLSRVHPAVPAIIFVPVIVIMEWSALTGGAYNFGQLILLNLCGVGIWTLSEYWLHRLLFHWEPSFRGGDRLHFMIHGVHHDHPNDKLRLVMPPAASIPLAAIFCAAFFLLFGTAAAYPLFAGFIAGYLVYDYTHYFIHHSVPRSNFGKRLREQHMRHHFQDHRFGFGVSSPFWDSVFRTLPRKRKR